MDKSDNREINHEPAGAESVYAVRHRRLYDLLSGEGVDAFLVTQAENRRYLTGFSGSNGWVLVAESAVYLLTDFRYWEQAESEAPHSHLVRLGISGNEAMLDALAGLLDRLGLAGRIAFEEDVVSVAAARRLAGAMPKVEWVGVSGWVEQLRLIKDAQELDRIRAAIGVAEEAFRRIEERIRPGISEELLAVELLYSMRRLGARKDSFDIIIASGPNAARPHGRAGARILQEGDLVVIDWGCEVDGYHSDMTRTFILGRAGERAKEIYQLVLEAQRRALSGIKPGMSCGQADALARDYLTAAGYGEFFGHGLGHGLGLAVHELPRLRRDEERKLAPGMVLSVEPGIYLPGFGGVRIEDLVVITTGGLEVLTVLPKDAPEKFL